MNGKDTKITLAVLSLVAVALLAFLAFGWFQLKGENEKTAELLVAVMQQEDREREEQAIRAAKLESAEYISAFENLVLTSEKLVPLIESIEAAGRGAKLDVKLASVDKQDGENGAPQVIRFAVNASGSWAGVSDFLRTVEALPYRVMIESVTLSKGDAGWSEAIVFSLHSFN